jgi:hypothetical protein
LSALHGATTVTHKSQYNQPQTGPAVGLWV